MEKLKIGEICSINPRQNDNIPENSEISFIPMAAVSANGQVDLSDTLESSKVKNYTVFRNGDVLFAKITPCMENGKGAIVHSLVNGYGAGSTEFIVLRPNADMITAKWLYLYLSQRSFRWECQQHMTGSAGQKRVPPKYLASCEIPVPAISEQERIVSKIEELFSRLDSSVAELKTAKEKLKVYRQAVLNKAFASVMQTGVVEISEIVDDIRIGPFGTALHKADYISGGIPVINPQHISGLSINANTKVTISREKATELSPYRLEENDIIMGRRGEMGRVAPVTNAEVGWICGTGSIIFRLKPEYDSFFYAQILSAPDIVHYLEDNATGTTMKNLNENIVKHIPVPKITREMQKDIFSNLEAQTSVCDSIEQTIDISLRQAEALRQSILKQAFEGALAT